MGYLVYSDYAVTIQDFAFKQWIAQNDAIRVQAEPRAQTKIIEYLVQRYDTASEFQNTTVYSDAATYQADALIQLNYPAWVSGVYAVGAYVSYTDGNVYRCIQITTNQAPGNTSYWVLIGPQLGLVYLAYPYPVFQLTGNYVAGNNVFWKGKIYTCLTPSIPDSHFADLQDAVYKNIPPANFFPDDTVNGPSQWGVGTAYSVTGVYPSQTASAYNPGTTYTSGQLAVNGGVLWQALKTTLGNTPGADIVNWQSVTWTTGDNRNQSIVDAYVAITLYYLSFRIAPKVIPEWVKDKYDRAMDYLQNAAEGNITIDLPEVQPAQGARIRFGGDVRQWNAY